MSVVFQYRPTRNEQQEKDNPQKTQVKCRKREATEDERCQRTCVDTGAQHVIRLCLVDTVP